MNDVVTTIELRKETPRVSSSIPDRGAAAAPTPDGGGILQIFRDEPYSDMVSDIFSPIP